jgi:hypothetical protein
MVWGSILVPPSGEGPSHALSFVLPLFPWLKWLPLSAEESGVGEATHVLRPPEGGCSLDFTGEWAAERARECLRGKSLVFIGDSVTR